MAVGFLKPGGSRRIRFTSNVSHGGKDYGPDCDEQEIELEAREAVYYVNQGRAQFVGENAAVEVETFEELPPQPGRERGGKK